MKSRLLCVGLTALSVALTALSAAAAAPPALTWNTLLGGTGTDYGKQIAVDASGNVYVTGYSDATWGAPVRAWTGAGGTFDAYVAKFDTAGNLLWNTFLGGSAQDRGAGIAVDESGNVYVAGGSDGAWAAGTPAPLRAMQGADAFVAKLDASGNLLWHTFLGGATTDDAAGIVLVPGAGVCVVGMSARTWGSPVRDFPPGALGIMGFVARLDAGGTLLWNTFLGGSNRGTSGYGVAVDANNNVYATGYSQESWESPVRPYAGGSPQSDAFVVKLDPDGALLWNTFLGGTLLDHGAGIVVDPAGNAYVAGKSQAAWGTPIQAWSGNYDGFAAKLDGNGNLLWSTFLGGANLDYAAGIVIGPGPNVCIVGETRSSWGTPFDDYAGDPNVSEAFVARLDTNGSLTANGFFGSNFNDLGLGIAADALGNVYLAGESARSWGTPVRPWTAATDAFAAEIGKMFNIPPVAVDLSLSTPEGTDLDVTLSATDVDLDWLQYAIVDFPAHGTITLGNTANRIYRPAAGYSGPDSFTYKANDGALDSNTATVAITVTLVNDPPTGIALSAASVAENSPAGSTVGSLSTTDGDAGDTFTYALVSGLGNDGNASFQIAGDALQTAAPLNYEDGNDYSVRVRSTDAGGLFFEKTFIVTVTDVNEAPTDIALSPAAVAERQPPGTVVGALSAADLDAGAALTYALVAGEGDGDNSLFAVVGASLQTNATLFFDSRSAYSVRVRATDQGGLWLEKQLAVAVTAVPCVVSALPASLDLPATGGSGSLAVTAPLGCAWSAASADLWIAITAGTPGSGDGTVSYAVPANLTARPRSGGISLTGGAAVTVEQAARPLTASFVALVGGVVSEHPSGPAPLEVVFDAGGSSGLEAITTYHWDFGDGATFDSSAAAAAHSYAAAGAYAVTLTVSAGSAVDSAQRKVTVVDQVHQVTTSAELQAALTAAQANGLHDLIRIATGVYGLEADGLSHFSYQPAAGENLDLVLEGGWTGDFSQRAYNLPTVLTYDRLVHDTVNGGVLFLDGAANGTTGTITVDGLTINAGRATGWGGGLYAVAGGGVTLTNSAVTGNTAGVLGGGVFLESGRGVVRVAGCAINGNTGGAGGGGVVLAPSATIAANEIRSNTASADGGLQALVAAGGELVVANNTIHGNTTLASGSSGLTVGAADSTGRSLLEVHNNIIFGNSGAPDFAVVPGCARLADDVELSVLANDLGSAAVCADYPLDASNVSVAPWFAANGPADSRLRASDTSLIDGGTNGGAPAQDIEGDPVPLDGGSGAATADIGADEYDPANPTGPTTLTLTPAPATIGTYAGNSVVTLAFDLPVKRDVVLYLDHADTNADSPGTPLVSVTPAQLKIPKGATGAAVTVSAANAPGHGTSQITASDPSGALPGGNTTVTVSIDPDTEAPTGSILINNGAVAVATTAVTLNLSAADTGSSGLVSMRFRTNLVEPYTAWEPFQTTRAWTLAGTPGTFKVYAQFSDRAGNLSDANPGSAGAQAYMDAIIYDPTAPTGSIQINRGAVSTGSTAVTLNLSTDDGGGSGVASMRFRNNLVEPYTAWEPFSTTRSWTLPSGLGTTKVYAQFRDHAGNVSDANPGATGAQAYMDAIELADKTPPTGSIRINGGAASTGTTAVTLNLLAADTGGSGLASMRFRNSTAEPYSAWEPFQTTKAWVLAGGAGTKKVYAQFADAAGCASDANPASAGAQGYSASILYTGP